MILFSKKIKCKHCGGNFKSKKERGKRKYICSRYDNYGECRRVIIEEDFLIGVINKRYGKELSEKEIKSKVDYIEVEDKLLFTIYLTDMEPIVFSRHNIIY